MYPIQKSLKFSILVLYFGYPGHIDDNNLKLAYLNSVGFRGGWKTPHGQTSVYPKASIKIKYKKCGSNT